MAAAIKVLIVALFLCALQSLVVADHLPASEIAVGKAEHMLGTINIQDDTVASVTKRIGPPDKFEESTSADLSGERSYEWDRKGIRLRMATEFYTDKHSRTLVESPPIIVDVWGQDGDQQTAITGRGLSIGDDLSKVKTIYGDHFQRDTHSLTLEWKDQTVLVIDFSNDGQIVHMQLAASQE